MKIRLIGLAIALLLVRAEQCRASMDNASANSASQPRLTIHLPRDIAVESEDLTLGQIAVVAGEDSLVAKARDIELGRISVAGQIITIDRSLILSRLACSGMSACNPVMSGADKVTVRRTAKVIKGSDIIESASSFLAGSVKEQAIARWEPVRTPADVILPAQTQNIELVPRLVARNGARNASRGANSQAITEVGVVADGKQIETRQVIFRAKYNVHRAITVTDVKEGATLAADNTRIEQVVSDEPEPAEWVTPYGLVAVRNLHAGTVVGSNMAKLPQPPVVIERNQTVVIRIERAGLVVTAMGKATQQGKLGECIKVRNVDSQRLILAKVNEDGTVEPVF
jgi:flagella basal body P-ring formation protein FlgA